MPHSLAPIVSVFAGCTFQPVVSVSQVLRAAVAEYEIRFEGVLHGPIDLPVSFLRTVSPPLPIAAVLAIFDTSPLLLPFSGRAIVFVDEPVIREPFGLLPFSVLLPDWLAPTEEFDRT